MHKGRMEEREGRRRGEKGSCRALSASAAALILHYGLGAMKSYFGELRDIKEEMERKSQHAAQTRVSAVTQL